MDSVISLDLILAHGSKERFACRAERVGFDNATMIGGATVIEVDSTAATYQFVHLINGRGFTGRYRAPLSETQVHHDRHSNTD